MPAGRKPGELVEEAKLTLEGALERIQAATESAIAIFRTLSNQPDEITMEFGFNLSATFGAVIATGTVEANYKVTLTWSQEKAKQ